MGGRSSSRNKQVGNRPITIALLGLDDAGKTTIAKVLEKTSVEGMVTTIGCAQYEVQHSNEKIKLFDLGGGEQFRESWRHYYDDAYGFIYVLDCSEKDRFDENREVLQRLLQEEKIQNKPILILANKQDQVSLSDNNTIVQSLAIEPLLTNNRNLYRVELCAANPEKGKIGRNSQTDPAVHKGFDWLVKIIYENYDTLHKRVQQGVRIRSEAQQKEKQERQERVARIREERAKREGGENDEDDNHPTTNGFVPIDQAIQNAEKNFTSHTNSDDFDKT